MGTNSKSSHSSYAVSPTVEREAPPAPVDIGAGAPPETLSLTEADLALLQAAPSAGPPELGEAPPAPPVETGAGEPLGEAETALAGEGAGSPAGAADEGIPQDEPVAEVTAAVEEAAEALTGSEGLAELDGDGTAEPVQALMEELEETDPPLTPVPDAPPVGVATGTPILVGGEDF